MKKLDLLEVLENELHEAETKIEHFFGSQNPQIIELYNMQIGKRDAIDATIHYIKTGSKNYF